MRKPARQVLNDIFASTRSTRSSYRISEDMIGYFPVTEFSNYNAFLAALGSSLKHERRTEILILRRPPQDSSGACASFVLKIYRYPFFPRIRTGFQISKAEREIRSLQCLNENGVMAAQGVGFGVERDKFGLVRSCFIITRFVDDAVSLSEWSDGALKSLDELRVSDVFGELGECFRRLHQARFFLFTAKAKNILIRDDSMGGSGICFIDLPYARTLKWPTLARWAQARDLGTLFANVNGKLLDMAIERFYRAYLPDPLANSSIAVQRYVLRQIRRKQNRTVISHWVHDIKRWLSGKSPIAGFLFLSAALYG